MPNEPDLEKDPTLPFTEANTGRLVLISGCSGGGKSSLLAELGRRGHAIVEEPGRCIVKEQLTAGGDALPWADAGKLAELAASRSVENMARAARSGHLTFFDRGLVDAVCVFERLGLAVPLHLTNAIRRYRYHSRVFLAPPWRKIFANDAERRHGFAEAVAEYEYLAVAFPHLGYETVLLPKTFIEARADFVLETLNLT